MPKPSGNRDFGPDLSVEEAKLLLNGALDDELTAEQTARFEWLRHNNSEFSREFDELTSLSVAISRMEVVSPPAHLKARIVDSLPHRPAPARATRSPIVLPKPKSRLLERLTALVQARPALAMAYTLAIGLVAGATFFGVLTDGGATSRSSAGTMGAVDADRLFDRTIGVPGAQATIIVRAPEDDRPAVRTVEVEVTDAPSDDVQLVLEFNPAQTRFKSFVAVNGPARVSSDTRKAMLWLVSGTTASYRLEFEVRSSGGGLGASLIRDDSVVAREQIGL